MCACKDLSGSSGVSAVAAPVRMSCPAETWGQTRNRASTRFQGWYTFPARTGPPETGTSSSVASGGKPVHHVPFKALGRQPLWEICLSSLSSTSRQTLTHPHPSTPFRNK